MKTFVKLRSGKLSAKPSNKSPLNVTLLSLAMATLLSACGSLSPLTPVTVVVPAQSVPVTTRTDSQSFWLNANKQLAEYSKQLQSQLTDWEKLRTDYGR